MFQQQSQLTGASASWQEIASLSHSGHGKAAHQFEKVTKIFVQIEKKCISFNYKLYLCHSLSSAHCKEANQFEKVQKTWTVLSPFLFCASEAFCPWTPAVTSSFSPFVRWDTVLFPSFPVKSVNPRIDGIWPNFLYLDTELQKQLLGSYFASRDPLVFWKEATKVCFAQILSQYCVQKNLLCPQR